MNLQTMNLNLLLAFEALMEERSVTRAARRIGVSQPAMSNALARLRETFDDPLFRRAADEMSPTPRAQALVQPIQAALGHLRTLFDASPPFEPAGSARVFNLLMNDYIELELLPGLVDALREGKTRIQLRVQRSAQVFEPPAPNLLVESHDMALGFFPDALVLDSRIRSRVLWEERSVCIARAGHPKIRGRLSLRQFAAADHAAIFYRRQGLGVLDTLLAQRGHARRTMIAVPHFTSVPFLVAGSDLIATVPERLAARFAARLRLQVLAPPLEIPTLRLTLVWHERFDADPAHRWLRDLIARIAGASRSASR